MSKGRPPDILRKSHRHEEGKERARAKQSLRRDLEEAGDAAEPVKALLIDLDGVVYEGERAVAGALRSLLWLRERHVPHLFVTNTTSRPRAALADKLAALGLPTEPERILTPPVAAAAWLREHLGGTVALFVPPATRGDFAGLPLAAAGEAPAAVVVGDCGEAWSFAELNRAFRLLMAEPPPRLVALGMTRYWRAPDGLRLDAGPFVAALAFAAGAEPVVVGKPAEAFFAAALERLGVAAADACLIGDDIRTDVGGAQQAGLRAALVKTGKFRPADLAGGVRPDAVLESLAELPDRWDGLWRP
jgi:HAD superfamily hydrolase (TIGR01458 family)